MTRSKPNPFRYFYSSPKVIRLAAMMYVLYPLSSRNVEDLLHEGLGTRAVRNHTRPLSIKSTVAVFV